MRILLALSLGTLVLAGCKRETQEAVAQAKGAAADAERAAKDAAAQARDAADQVAASARSGADQARAAADDAAARARGAAGAVGDSARRGLDNAGQTMHELTGGDQVQGVIVSAGRTELDVRPPDGPVRTLSTDDQTRWILHGSAAGRGGFPIGSSVRVTYIVMHGKQVATQVEAVGR